MDSDEYLCDLTRKLWRYYLLEPTTENFEELYKVFGADFVMIGTGKHEFFTDFSHAVSNFEKNQREAEQIRFEILDEWYEAREVTPEVYLVYGGLWARQLPQSDKEILVDMDTRFSAVYRSDGARWQLVHLHHSVPNFEQNKGEFYPKSIAQKASEALALAKLFQRRAELDLMTGIYNHESFRAVVQKKLDDGKSGLLLLYDIDNFKRFNDTYGHLCGDAILKLFAKLLAKVFRGAYAGRMGGDEFAVFYPGAEKKAEAERLLKELDDEFCRQAEAIVGKGDLGFSTGIAAAEKAASFTELFKCADEALYEVKRTGKKACRFFSE